MREGPWAHTLAVEEPGGYQPLPERTSEVPEAEALPERVGLTLLERTKAAVAAETHRLQLLDAQHWLGQTLLEGLASCALPEREQEMALAP